MSKNFPCFLTTNQSLKDVTYYKMGGIAEYFATPKNISELQELLFWCVTNKKPCAVLGAGSNSVYADGVFKGVVISLAKMIGWFWETDSVLFVEAGVTNTEIAEICLAANRGGATWMYRMPGQLGASIRMNARCYGGEMSQIVQSVITLNMDGQLKTYTAQEVFQGYKSTRLMQSPEIVIGARLFLPNLISPAVLFDEMSLFEADRHKKKHFYLPSCGSTFKNNYTAGKPSGQLFDSLGLKGRRVGHAEVSQFHANFVWNTGDASTVDMLTLAAEMRESAKSHLSVDLELEVQPVGIFSCELFEKCGMKQLGPHYSFNQSNKWIGLLYHPQNQKLTPNFPCLLYEGLFLEYLQTPFMGCATVGVQFLQIDSLENAKKNPLNPFLRWITYSTETPEKIFFLRKNYESKINDNIFTDELWNFSVSEIFLANYKNPENNYLEFEMTPYGEWVAIEFDGIRKRTGRNKTLSIDLWKNVKINNLCTSFYNNNEVRFVFGMSFNYNQIKTIIDEESKFIYIQCALSLGNNRYYLSPYWKYFAKNKINQKIDFHQPKKFWKLKLF
ncbi:MAG: UDP-N-acetylmuramate dehydrogenase [Spirobacillus cienkowskii]|jgi:UDP-N-acetylmuramate dehydrogenase|uniref:UDP-N-acetylenolpyruvoylglucosamine reductase n=1 Tax=Spirobacillus cienkowskii TaxID=495820 RepID=A0A369KT60_9BACT|nr:MAG: UDP-N-acetylmuramate dehydrogenase [Spirobacillus cienkowskii]